MGDASGPFRLPKLVEQDPRATALLTILTSKTRPLWPGGEIEVPTVGLDHGLADALRSVHKAGRVVRGLESARQKLAAEERGLNIADRRAAMVRGGRVSRLLLLSSDGAERFYRHVETLLRRNEPRVLAVRLSANASELGEVFFGPDHPVRLLMIEHKEAVSTVLLAMASRVTDEDDPAPAK